jgi:hypothetical protein
VSDPRSLELIDELARDLEPVHPIAPLHRALAGVALAWVVAAAAGLAAVGVHPEAFAHLRPASGAAAALAGLGAAGLGALVASLALAVPGRDAAARWGLAAATVGLSVAAAACVFAFATAGALEGAARATAGSHLACGVFACAVGLLPALGAVAFAARAAPHRHLALVLAAAAGASALGALSAKAICAYADPAHLLAGHLLAPLAGALVLALPLRFALVRLRRWASRAGNPPGAALRSRA